MAEVRPRLGVDRGRFRVSAGEDGVIPERERSSEVIFLVSDSPEGGLEAHALGEAIFTQANSMEELESMVRDAVECHFDEPERPALIRLHLVRDVVIPA